MKVLAVLRRFWPALIVLALGLWAARLDHLRADYRQTLTNERAAWSGAIADAEKARLAVEARYARQQASAAATFASALAERQPIIVRSTNTVREYAKTDAGRGLCLPADRVRGTQTDRDALFAEPSGSTERSSEPMQAGSPSGPG